jgi:hypothetical protein
MHLGHILLPEGGVQDCTHYCSPGIPEVGRSSSAVLHVPAVLWKKMNDKSYAELCKTRMTIHMKFYKRLENIFRVL